MAYYPIIIAPGSPVTDPFTNQYFTLAGNQLATFTPGTKFVVFDNNTPVSNVYAFETLSAVFVGSDTQVTPTTPILDIAPYTYQQAVDGNYTVQWSDCSKPAMVIEVAEIDSTTSLNLPGRGVLSYGEAIDQNLLHLLENFAGPYSPDDPLNPCNSGSPLSLPVVGQLWFDTSGSPSANVIRVWNGTLWAAFDGSGTGFDDYMGSAAFAVNLTTDGVGPSTYVNLQTGITGLRYQQVFFNGVLQREDNIGFPGSGNYYIDVGNQYIVFAFDLGPSDEVLVYAL